MAAIDELADLVRDTGRTAGPSVVGHRAPRAG